MSPTGPLAILESRIKNLLIEHASLEESVARREERSREERRRLLSRVIEGLDLVEDYARELASAAPDSPGARYLEEVRRFLARALGDEGVEEIPGTGALADPSCHRVVETVADPDRPDGAIVREYRRAYRWKGQILREGQVVAVRNDPASSVARSAAAIREPGTGGG